MSAVKTGTMIWFDFPTTDEAKAMEFYKKIFQWRFTAMGPSYWVIYAENRSIGGLRKESFKPANSLNTVIPYFTVASCKEGSALIEKSGGKVIGETVPIDDGKEGFFQHFLDPDENLISLWSLNP